MPLQKKCVTVSLLLKPYLLGVQKIHRAKPPIALCLKVLLRSHNTAVNIYLKLHV